MESKILSLMKGKKFSSPPIWMMRQAGRYLPEYREVRKKAGSFLDLCYNPELAAKATLQPVNRFDLDAAILFSDILVIPHALGRDLDYEDGTGPIMNPITEREITKLDLNNVTKRLSPVFETIERVKSALDKKIALIGFCGAPWTIATYMIAGRSETDSISSRLFLYQHPEIMQYLLDCLADISADYLIQQINSGADLVQIFDSWAGATDQLSFEKTCIAPVARIIKRVRQAYPSVPIIGFPRGAGIFYTNYAKKTGVTALGLDWRVPLSFAKKLQKDVIVQGNLDPLRLVAGKTALDEGIDNIMSFLGNRPFIFNLGHGIVPDTPVKHVEYMIRRVRSVQTGI